MSVWGTTADENGLGLSSPWTDMVVHLSGADEPVDESDPGCL